MLAMAFRKLNFPFNHLKKVFQEVLSEHIKIQNDKLQLNFESDLWETKV
jgi:septum formation topological specificity factor MinE